MHNPSAFFARVRSHLDRPRWGLLVALGWLALCAAESRAADAAAPVFARVADSVITQREYDDAYAVAARSRFYHGKAPQADVAKLQREVGHALVNEALLLREAARRKLQPDAAAVQQQIDAYEARYRSSEAWQKNRATMLPPLRRKLERNSMLDQLHAAVHKVDEPTPAQVEAYYDQHKDKFTEPERVRLSMILLKVDPSSPQAKWDAAAEEGAAIVKRLRGGADFAQMAHLHSGDASAAKGGALDYLHRGMLPERAQLAVDKLQPSGISDPVVLIEGIAVFKLDERKAARLNPLPVVRPRTAELLKRELGERAWTDLLARLRKENPPRIDESRYLPLALVAPQAPTTK
jgi:parvulin-like peptidyl-prolyl isomerase